MSSPVSFCRGIACVAVVCALGLSFTSCGKKQQAQGGALVSTVETVQPSLTNVPVFKEWVGKLTGKVNATIVPQVSGYLLEQCYQNGQVVKKGDVLFKIDPRTFVAVLEKAQGNLAQQEALLTKNKMDVERYAPLVKSGAVSQKQLDDAIQAMKESQAGVEACQAAVSTAKLNLDFTVVTSPIDGIAGIAKAQIGDLVSPGGMILTQVSQVNPIRIDFAVTEQDWLDAGGEKEKKGVSLDQGNDLQLILANKALYSIKARATAIDREVSATMGTLNVQGEVANPNRLLRPGMFVTVRAQVAALENVFVVPQTAVVNQQGSYLLVLVNEEGVPSIAPIKPGPLVGQNQVVTPLIPNSLSPKSQVVAQGTLQALRAFGENSNPANQGKPKMTLKAIPHVGEGVKQAAPPVVKDGDDLLESTPATKPAAK